MPGSGRTHFLQYTYTAKLGIEGKDVDIRETADNEFTIVIPAFTFIGHSDPTFETVLEDGGVLRFVSPEIDTAAVITDVLNGEAKTEHVVEIPLPRSVKSSTPGSSTPSTRMRN